MNWKSISEKYPKAWGVFIQTYKYHKVYIGRDGNLYMKVKYGGKYYRTFFPWATFYDLFDQIEIYISVRPFGKFWIYEINGGWIYEINGETLKAAIDAEFNSRTSAEEAAFEKAFQLLEERLKK